jgi:hypothetical protein
MYSCALWCEVEGGFRKNLEMGPTSGDLVAGQRRKIHHILRARVDQDIGSLNSAVGGGGGSQH